MALTGLHTNWQNGSYDSDRNWWVKQRENAELAAGRNLSRWLSPHWDGGNSLAIGYGFDLLVRSNAEINNYLNQLSDALGLTGTHRLSLSQNDMTLLDQARSRTATQAYLEGIANQLTITLPDEPTASTLLSIKLNEYENALNTALGGSNQLLQSQERIAVISLLYTMSDSTSAAISNAIPSTITAIRHDNRAEAWFEIRYNSNRNGIHANRRYDESDLFGLLDSGAFTVEGTKEVFRMFTKHQSEISAYESAYPPPSSSSIALYTQVQLAKDYLVNQFGRGKSIDEIIVGAGLQSYAYLEKWTIDKIFGTDGNDLIFGEDYFLMRRAA